MCTINVNVVRGRSYEIFRHENLSYKNFLTQNFQIYSIPKIKFYCLSAKAVVAEADVRMTEMKKAAYEFDRDIVRGAVNAVRQI